ncbi:helix-turn-helix domain-containing protein [Shouchella lonarensis]|uniref:Transcriptional regulator, XRE family /transcriptional regulator n=1 Tax=Shouchella lonarensis TaxID=1464122 RepID=A0A1G6HKH3_9BACI|nr:helix-turn-helix transcriptional regulator [Shouchella lonarensis]SDB94827.1 transcriptional regulator, XRE family /transcriptional regulator [Shouchella lonarensis]
MKLGERLKTLRESQALSREDVAQSLNVSRQAIYKWETDKGYPDLINLMALSELFQVTVDELLKGKQEVAAHEGEQEDWEDEEEEEDAALAEVGDHGEVVREGDIKEGIGVDVDVGFAIGLIMMVIGAILDLGQVSILLMVLGVMSIVFLDDCIESVFTWNRQRKERW